MQRCHHITLPLIYLMAFEAATVCGSPLYMAPEILSLEAKVMEIAQVPSLTNIAPEDRPGPKRKYHLSSIHFKVLC